MCIDLLPPAPVVAPALLVVWSAAMLVTCMLLTITGGHGLLASGMLCLAGCVYVGGLWWLLRRARGVGTTVQVEPHRVGIGRTTFASHELPHVSTTFGLVGMGERTNAVLQVGDHAFPVRLSHAEAAWLCELLNGQRRPVAEVERTEAMRTARMLLRHRVGGT